ncbi:MAG: hypothetical protein ACON36_07665 [Ilumatobacteraceae bacterium]
MNTAPITLEASTFLLQWSTGGMLLGWVTTRRREVSLGYGWMLRLTYGPLAVGAVIAGFLYGSNLVRDAASALVAVTIGVAFVSSVVRKSAGVSGAQKEFDRRSERVAAMTGIDRATTRTATGREFHPILDLVPAMIGVVGLIAAGLAAASDGFLTDTLSVGRLLVGSLFLGAVTNAMLLGHWYLVQPGLPRKHLNELVDLLGKVWPFEVLVLLAPTGMVSVLNGSIDDGWGGVLGWFWVTCALTTIVLVVVTKAALRERQYSAVMAATGLLYLAILTAFGTDLVARAVLDAAVSTSAV